MKVSDSHICVAYHFKQKYNVISSALLDPKQQYTTEYIKNYILCLVGRAKATKAQRRIKKEVEDCFTRNELLTVVSRVIRNGEATEFTDYYKRRH